MTDQQLRLGATFHDGATPAIRKLKGELGAVKVMPGMMAAGEWMEKFTAKSADFVKGGGGMVGVLDAMGVAGLGAAGSLVALVGHFKALSDHVLTIRELGREVGLTTNQLNQFAQAGAKFGVGAEAIEDAVNAFKSQMPQFMVGTGNLFNELAQRAPNLVKALKLEDTEHQLKTILDYLGQAKLQANPQQQKQMAELFFPGHGDDIEKLFAKGPKGFAAEVERLQKTLPSISPELEKQSEDLRDSVTKLNQSIEIFDTKAGPAFIKVMTAIVDLMSKEVDFIKEFAANPKSFAPHLGTPTPAQADKVKQGRQEFDKHPWFWLNPLHWFGRQKPDGDKPGDDGKAPPDKLLHRSSYAEDAEERPKLWKTSFGDGDAPTATGVSASSMLTEGVKQGVLAAFREWQAQSAVDGGGGGAGGLMKVSYETGSPGGGGGGGGGGLGDVTTVTKSLPKEARAFLDAIAAGEAKDYNVMNGGGRFSDYSRHPGGRAAGRYQDLPSTWARIQRATGLSDFSPESQDKGNWWLAQQDYRAHTGRDLLSDLQSKDPNVIANVGRALHSTWVSTNGSFASRYQGALNRGGGPAGAAAGSSYPGHIDGRMKIGDASFRFGSGGVRGASSIPFGDYPITPDGIGAWGRSHGALGINNDHIYDKALGRMRDGIEMHAGHTAALITEGCLAFQQDQWPEVKARVLDMVHHHGRAFLHVGKDGASITPEPLSPAKHLPDINKPDAAAPASANGGDLGKAHIHIDLHDRGSNVRSARVMHDDGLRVTMRRWPTGTEPSMDA